MSPSRCRTPKTEDIRFVLNQGNNLMTRFWLSLGSLLSGLGIFAGSASWLTGPAYAALAQLFPPFIWATMFTAVGALGFWRVLSSDSKPWCAWAVNVATAFVWTAVVAARLSGGASTLGSLHTLMAMMALWCLARTEATARDTRTA